MPKISIIMNCYNSDTFLRKAIDSIYAQTYSDWEIIFWDNQSTDKSASIAMSYDRRLRYFLAEEFLSLGAARNKALEKVQGEYIAFLDCDDEWFPEKLEVQIKVFESDLETDFIYSNFFMVNMQLGTKKLSNNGMQPSGDIFRAQCGNYTIGILTVVFKASLLQNLNEWFDSKLNIAEEFELFLRILVFAKAYYLDQPLALYRVHGNNITQTQKVIFANELRYIVEKFSALDIITSDIRISMEKLLVTADIEDAKLFLREGKPKEAKERILEHRNLNKENKIIYILSCMPPMLSRPSYKALAEIYKRFVYYK